ncbi:methyl-accepting chemotaxis protein [Bacillus sp. FSL W8-1127]|uniref:methyl-accepting chemotaxis protein n=1 Tax=Bacillus sp. FSL W8-1127 TaxID=2954710 RepID=UPI0030F71179
MFKSLRSFFVFSVFLLVFMTMGLTIFLFTTFSVTTAMILCLCWGLLISYFFLSYTSKHVQQPLREFDVTIRSVTDKVDLSKRSGYRSQNEMGIVSHGLNKMLKGLRNILLDVKEYAVRFSDESDEIAKASHMLAGNADTLSSVIEELSNGITDQANRADISKTTMEKMVKDIKEVEQGSNYLNEVVNTADHRVYEGREKVKQVNATIMESVKMAESLNEATSQLKQASSKANNILQLIGNIANQTNLLALNAAIEAARAGDQGKGFAVVAEKIRSLSEETSKSVEQVNEMLKQIQHYVHTSALESKSIHEVTNQQEQLSKQLDNAFQNISDIMHTVSEETKKMTDASHDTLKGIEKVFSEMEAVSYAAASLASGSQQAAASIQEQSATTKEMANRIKEVADLAVELRHLSERWKGLK